MSAGKCGADGDGMSCKREAALDAACDLLTTDLLLVEALEAYADGKDWFYPTYDRADVEVEVHLLKVADQALDAQCKCHFAGLTNLAEYCARIDLRLRRICAIGGKDAMEGMAEISRLTKAGQEALNVAMDEAPYLAV